MGPRPDSAAQTPILTVTLNPALDLATTVETVLTDVKLRCAAPQIDPGGGGINVSRAIAALGGTSTAAVSLGGLTGARLSAVLEDAGIAALPLPAPGETRESVTVTETGSGRQFRFVMPGPTWGATDVAAALQMLVDAAVPGGMVVVSGSQPPGVPADFAVRLAARLAQRRAMLCVDTSGPALHALRQARAGVALLRMDGAEAEDLAGRPLPTRAESAAFAGELVAEGVARTVVVARGGDGNIVAGDGAVWHAEALRVPVVSRVGAGDSFLAAFVLARARGSDLPQALGWGAAAASAACMTPATELCLRADVEHLYELGCVTAMR